MSGVAALRSPNVQPDVVFAPPGLLECQAKLVRIDFDRGGALSGVIAGGEAWAFHGSLGLEPSDPFGEFLAAYWAFERPKVLVTVHEASPRRRPVVIAPPSLYRCRPKRKIERDRAAEATVRGASQRRFMCKKSRFRRHSR